MADSKPSPVEIAKIESNYLRGTIPGELLDGEAFFSKDNTQLLKHHGTYQQDDRDARAASRASGGKKSDKEFIFMVRTRVPGGRLSSAQLLAELDLCDELGNTTLRITSRQALQLHGIAKEHLWETIHRINQVQLTTLAACGDVERNIMCCPAPRRASKVQQQLEEITDRLTDHLAPRTRAYHEIWVKDPETGDSQLVAGGPPDHEPIYGPTYLPRKFKTAIALASDNCVDIYTQDLGFLAITEGDEIIGFNVLAGGGQGTTPSNANTFPALAQRLTFVRPDDVLAVAEAIIKVQRDFGNRSDRKRARMKYLIHDWGLEKFKAKVEEYFGRPLPEPHPADVHGFDDHIGWHEQGDGRWFYGLNVENGRIHDVDNLRLKTALREICTQLAPPLRLTSHQSILFCDIAAADRDTLTGILREHGVTLSEDISEARRWSMACVAWPTCGLAITESERALPGMIDQLEGELARLGLSAEQFTIRMTGCPNGCARPYNCDVGLVGRTAGKYTVFLGGRLLGNRLNEIYKDQVPAEEVVSTLVPVFAYFKQARQPGETFGDFCHRQGMAELAAWSERNAAATAG
ncbi:MAG: NADPH-dependent assimilatory sulfite reductase hemoprotein subunit [Pirellulales bacterium]